MIVPVANPIYDTVFKYLMEDERIAKTILSALLKKEVVHVQVRPHEYVNTTRDTLSMFRIDFAATVREVENGKAEDRVVLIELQKTWLNTETLRFRQYLGAQYSSKNNIRSDSRQGYAYPMVAVYLLGHRLGHIAELVVYVNHNVYDYDGQAVAGGNDDPFVESLTHNSIIVQIPLLHGNVNNRLERVLSVFDQTQMDANDTQVLRIDETMYEGDADMMYLIHRLTAAAADAVMRQDMNVEDEYYQAIEDRDTAIMQRDKEIEQRNKEIEQRNKEIEQRNRQLEEKDKQLSERDAQLSERDAQLSERDAQLSERDAQLSERDAQLSERDAQLKTLARALYEKGIPESQIAQMTGMSKDELTTYLH